MGRGAALLRPTSIATFKDLNEMYTAPREGLLRCGAAPW